MGVPDWLSLSRPAPASPIPGSLSGSPGPCGVVPERPDPRSRDGRKYVLWEPVLGSQAPRGEDPVKSRAEKSPAPEDQAPPQRATPGSPAPCRPPQVPATTKSAAADEA